jgi:hypothetical protein
LTWALLFQIITEREDAPRSASAPTCRSANGAAIVDRVTFNAHILETGTESYRLRTSKTSTRHKQAS